MSPQILDDKSIFNIARHIDVPDARLEYLDQVCGQDQEAVGRIIALLEMHDREKTFLESPFGVPSALLDLSEAEILGTQIGPYKIRELLGEGGMGSVYVADQEKPVRRRVALKVVKAGMDSRQVLARFGAEREVLALMDRHLRTG